jgi:autotransporter-associated beta strand protein
MNGFNQAFVGILDVAGNGKIINNGVADSTLTVGSTNNYTTYGDVLAGAGTLNVVKVGSGSQTLASANITYAGTTTVSQGQLVINNATTLATSITVAGGATLDTEATTTGTLTLSNNAVLVANGSTAGALTASSIDATASPINVSFSAAPAPAADVIILSAAGGITGSAANFQVLGARSGTFSLQNGNTELHYVAPASATTLTWKGNDPVSPTFWDLTTSTNWSNAGNPDKFYTGDNVLFDNSATTFNVAIQGASVAPAAVTFNSASNYVVSGGAISGATTVDKSGSGTVTLASGNSYSGQTTVSAGVLAIKTSSSLGSTSAGTVISGSGTLDFGAATTANGIDLAAEVVTVSGSGNGGAGAIINNSALQQLNALRQLVLAGNASVGGPGVSLDGNQQPISTGVGRWDMRGTGNAMDMAGNTLTKVGSNFVSLAGTTISNPGNIVIESGVLGIQKEANLNGSAANSLTIQSNGILNFFESFVAPTWTLNLTNGSRFWTQSGTGTGTNVWAGPVALNGAAVLDANGGTMIISGNVSGPGSFTKVGPNTTSLYGDSTYSGGTTITNGVIWAGANTALGTGPVTINSSAIRLVVADNQTITNHIIINGGGASFRGLIENSGAGNATLAGSTITVNGPVSAGGHFASAGGGTLTISNAIVATVNTNIVSRIGTVIFAGGGSYAGFSVAEGTVRLGANNGLCPTSLVSVATSANANLDLAGFSQTLSGIQRTSGSAAVITNSSTVSDSTLTLVGTSSYSGLINDASVAGSRIALNVNGGNLTLSGTNTYSGGTVVTNGTLHINATTAAGTGTVAAKNGGTLSGNGTVSGAATLDAGSTLAPGNNGIGTLTFSSGLAIGGNVAVELNKSLAQSNDLVSVTGSLNKTGTGQLIVSNLGPALVVGDKFTLFSPALGNGAALTIVPPAGVTFTNNLAVDGSITVLTVPSLTPPTLNFVNLGGGSLQFSWTGGGTLQAQTNSLSVGLGTNWVDYPGSSPVTVPMNPANGSVFFRVKQ